MFAHIDGIVAEKNADSIVIDAYTGMTTGYKFTLKYLELDTDESGLDKKAIRAAINIQEFRFREAASPAADRAPPVRAGKAWLNSAGDCAIFPMDPDRFAKEEGNANEACHRKRSCRRRHEERNSGFSGKQGRGGHRCGHP